MNIYASNHQGVFVSIFLRGGMDGLHALIPASDPHYAALRPTLRQAAEEAADLDGFFRLHNALTPLQDLYHEGHLAMVDRKSVV